MGISFLPDYETPCMHQRHHHHVAVRPLGHLRANMIAHVYLSTRRHVREKSLFLEIRPNLYVQLIHPSLYSAPVLCKPTPRCALLYRVGGFFVFFRSAGLSSEENQ